MTSHQLPSRESSTPRYLLGSAVELKQVKEYQTTEPALKISIWEKSIRSASDIADSEPYFWYERGCWLNASYHSGYYIYRLF
jgi:hypothetical protein